GPRMRRDAPHVLLQLARLRVRAAGVDDQAAAVADDEADGLVEEAVPEGEDTLADLADHGRHRPVHGRRSRPRQPGCRRRTVPSLDSNIRSIPETERGVMTKLYEDLVAVERDAGMPAAFTWRGRRYEVRDVIGRWLIEGRGWDEGRYREYWPVWV